MREAVRRMWALAGRQRGFVSTAQLYALGMTESAIAYRVSTGLLIRVYHGVYAVGRIPEGLEDQAFAALLACGSRSALAYGSAASLWGIQAGWSRPFEVIVPGHNRRPRGISVHHSSILLRRDIRIQKGLRVTSPALTVLHNAPKLNDKRLARAVDELRLAGYLTESQLVDVVERFPRHPGAKRVRRLLGLLHPEPTRSEWEREWSGFALKYGLPAFEMNVHVCGYRVDVLFPGRLIVELDGWSSHRSLHAFEHDRDSANEILAQTGMPTARITHRQFHQQPGTQAKRVLAILRRDRSGG